MFEPQKYLFKILKTSVYVTRLCFTWQRFLILNCFKGLESNSYLALPYLRYSFIRPTVSAQFYYFDQSKYQKLQNLSNIEYLIHGQLHLNGSKF